MNLKKIILALFSLVFVIVAAGFFMFVFPFTGTKDVQPGATFGSGKVFNVLDGISQVFVIDGGNGEIALIDAGNSSDGKPLIDALASRGFKTADVKAIFLTHGHSDHVAAAKIFTNARIYTLKEEAAQAEGKKRYSSPIGRLFPPVLSGFKVTNILNDGDHALIGSVRVDVFAVPGHTEGGAAYLADGVLFLGDAALSSKDGKITRAVWIFSDDVDRQSRSLKALAGRLVSGSYPVKQIVFSHSGPLEGLQPLIDYAADVK